VRELCAAIASLNVVQFYYTGDRVPGIRTVEPHMVAFTQANNLVLGGWFLGGASESQEGQGWREYRLDAMSNLMILDRRFPGPRNGYDPTGGDKLKKIQCQL
jgi:predicted DNA-binding transcriptional regulator YafY